MLKYIYFATKIVGLTCLLLSASCNRIKLPGQLADANLSINVVRESLGNYTIAGVTNLPEKSQVAIIAVRYLYLKGQGAQALNPKPTYAVLAYETTEVNQGKWSTQLNLWQTARDGRFQELWQLDQDQLKLPLQPAKDVVFLATLAPLNQVDQLQSLGELLAKQNLKVATSLVHTTMEGQQYVQVGQTQDVPLPTGRTAPRPLRPEDINGGWGERYLIPLEPQNPYKLELPPDRRTNAPASPEEFLQ
jgi:hypothetical protein